MCPSPSRLTSTPDSSWSASATAHSYGVAGSRVVPTTTIGAAPAAVMSRAVSVDFAWMPPQPISPHANTSPKVGEASSNAGIWSGTSSAVIANGSSRQLIA